MHKCYRRQTDRQTDHATEKWLTGPISKITCAEAILSQNKTRVRFACDCNKHLLQFYRAYVTQQPVFIAETKLTTSQHVSILLARIWSLRRIGRNGSQPAARWTNNIGLMWRYNFPGVLSTGGVKQTTRQVLCL